MSVADFLFAGVFDLPWWGLVLVALALTHVTIAGVTIYLHRCQAHRALDLHPLPAHFFRFWLWLTTGMVTKEWAAIHRKHHAKCETDEDPHSPQVYGINRVLWGGVFLYVAEAYNRETLERYGHGTPDDWMERNVYSRFTLSGLTLMGLDERGAVRPDSRRAHSAGRRSPGSRSGRPASSTASAISGATAAGTPPDASTNIVPWGILIGGEELHNNHHAYATSAKLSNKWYEFDIGWMYIRTLEVLGLAQVKKVAPTAALHRGQAGRRPRDRCRR